MFWCNYNWCNDLYVLNHARIVSSLTSSTVESIQVRRHGAGGEHLTFNVHITAGLVTRTRTKLTNQLTYQPVNLINLHINLVSRSAPYNGINQTELHT